MFGIGMTELLVILVVGLLVLGPKRLPDLARSLGRGLAEFRRASSDMRREFLDVTEDVRRESNALRAPASGRPDEKPADATLPKAAPASESQSDAGAPAAKADTAAGRATETSGG